MLRPADVVYPLRREQDMLAPQPFARVDDHVTDRPALVVEHERFDTSDRAVRRHDFVANHFLAAAKMRVRRVALLIQASLLLARKRFILRPCRAGSEIGRGPDPRHGIHAEAPCVYAFPVVGIAVIIVVIDLVLSRNRLVGVDARAVTDLLPGETDVHHTIIPGHAGHRTRRDQYLALAQPASGLDDHVPNDPAPIVEIEILDLAELAVTGTYRVACQLADVV